jgi:hypothetical protein
LERPVNRELVTAKLDLIAAKAKELSLSLKDHRLWEGDLAGGIGEILHEAQQLAQSDLIEKDRKAGGYG